MNGKGVGPIVTASTQVCGLEDLGKVFIQLCYKGVSGAANGLLRPARSFRKVGGFGISRHIDIACCRMNGKIAYYIAIQVSRLDNLSKV
jgi:hypothetical protein